VKTELIIALFENDESGAGRVLEKVREYHKEGLLRIHNVATLVMPQEGEAVVNDVNDVDKKQGTRFGAVTGGIIGLLGGPVGVIIGAAAGAATGRVTANLADYGVPDKLLEQVKSKMQPGSSAIILYAEMKWADKAVRTLEENGAKVYHDTIEGDLPLPGSPNVA